MKKKKIIIIIALAVVVVVGVSFAMMSGKKEVRFVTAIAIEDNLQILITATGYVQPVDKVEVGTQVSGVIEKIYVDYNSQVKKGQLLAELDKSTLSEKLTQANAGFSSAQSDLTFAQQNYDRIKQLHTAKAATQASYEDAVNKLAQAKTNVSNTKANVHQAKVNLSYAEIYSPINGVILNRAIEQGQTVAASFSTPTLFTIANDLTKMQVEANVDEADIGKVKMGQDVEFTVDAYEEMVFKGMVSQIRLQPTVASNVVTYTVIVEAPNPDEKLFPGMTANISIITKSERGIMVPSEALKFNPSSDIMKKLKIDQHNINSSEKTVWVETNKQIQPKKVTVGSSDGINTNVVGINVGDTVVLSASLETVKKQAKAVAANPLMPTPPGKK